MGESMRLIDADAFLKDILTAGIGKTITEYSESDIGYMIRKRPTVDVAQVKHGRWDDSGRYKFPGGSIAVRCSECGCALTASEYKLNNWNYCPVCGAKMDGDWNG